MSSYSSTYPSVSPTYQIDFANGGRIPPNATFSRPDSPINLSNAPAAGLHYWSNEKHLSSENLIKHSEGSAVWGGTATVTYNYTNGPDGVTGTALRLESASGTERYRYSTGGQFVSGTVYTVSCWVKSNTGVAQTFRFMCSTTANQSSDLTTHATDWTRVTATITPNTTNIFAGFVFLSANTNDISVWGLQVNTGSDELDYQATTTSIHRQYAPTLKSPSTAGAARFEHDPVTNASLGCLIESQSTNLLLASESFNDSNWTKGALNIDLNAAIAPDGSLSADLARPTTASGAHYALTGVSTTASSTYTASVYVKAAGYSKVRLFFYQASSPNTHEADATFTLSGSGSVTTLVGSSTITAVGGGYYRISVTGVAGTSNSNIQIRPANDAGSDNFAADGYSGILLYGAQFEQASHASSYITTLLSARTRAADQLSVATADIGYTGGPFTVVSETSGGLGNYPRAFTLTDGSLSNRLTVHRTSGAATTSTDWLFAGHVDGSSNVSETIPSSASAGKLAVSYDTNDVSVCASGGTVATDSSAVFPDGLTTMKIGANYAGGQQLNGHVKRVALYNEALSDTNLQAITS